MAGHIQRLLLWTLAASIVLLVSGLSPRKTKAQQPIILSVQFQALRQGTVGLITLSGTELAGASILAFGHIFICFPMNHGLACLLAVPADQRTGNIPFQISVLRQDQTPIKWQGAVKVIPGQFLRGAQVILPRNKLYLLQSKIESREEQSLLSVYHVVTPERFWEGAFLSPVPAKMGSTFGSIRTYNDGLNRQHLGDDLPAATGTPVRASATGRVVFAHPLDIHGNTVILDHGWGIFSAYSHLKTMDVVPGQLVLGGEVIGLTGTTGRSTGPHVHWEIAVDDIQIDPLSFERLTIPA